MPSLPAVQVYFQPLHSIATIFGNTHKSTTSTVQDHIDQLAYEQTKHLSGKQAKKQYQARRKELEAMAHKIIAGCVATQDSRPKLRYVG